MNRNDRNQKLETLLRDNITSNSGCIKNINILRIWGKLRIIIVHAITKN